MGIQLHAPRVAAVGVRRRAHGGNIVNLFTEVSSIGSAEARSRGGDPFWERSMRSLVRNCVDALVMAGEPATLHAMFDVVRSAPPDLADPGEPAVEGRVGVLAKSWRSARERACGTSWEIDCLRGRQRDTWLTHFPALGEKTRSSIVAMFSTLAEALMRGKMPRTTSLRETTLGPEDVLLGRVVVVDLPVKEWAEVGHGWRP